jgi:hypothetical protein
VPVYGYVRSSSLRPRHLLACRVVLARYCLGRNLRLDRVFVDHGVPGYELARPGFDDLCQALHVRAVYGVVVVHRSHMSPDEAVAAQLLHQLGQYHVPLMIVFGRLVTAEDRS